MAVFGAWKERIKTFHTEWMNHFMSFISSYCELISLSMFSTVYSKSLSLMLIQYYLKTATNQLFASVDICTQICAYAAQVIWPQRNLLASWNLWTTSPQLTDHIYWLTMQYKILKGQIKEETCSFLESKIQSTGSLSCNSKTSPVFLKVIKEPK